MVYIYGVCIYMVYSINTLSSRGNMKLLYYTLQRQYNFSPPNSFL